MPNKIKFTHDDFDNQILKAVDTPMPSMNDALTKLRQAAGLAPKTPNISTPTIKLPRMPKI